MKKILFIHHGSGIGGAGLSLLHLVRSLDKSKFHPVVLFLHDSEILELYRQYGIEIAGIVGKPDLSHTVMMWHRWYHGLRMLRALWSNLQIGRSEAARWYDKIKPDIVHLNTSSLWGWAAAARRRKIPVVCHIREPLAPGYLGIRRWLTRLAVATWAHRIVAISKHDVTPWKHLVQAQVVYNAVDGELFSPKLEQTKADQKTILFLGGLSQEKGTLTILLAFEQVLKIEPDARLIIAGYFDHQIKSPWNLRYYTAGQAYVRRVETVYQRVAQAVELTGPTTKVPELMQRSSVVVFPATIGHFARPIIEAGFMALPVVASKRAPLDELVIDGVTGFLVSPQDVEQWVEKISLLLQNPKQALIMGSKAYDFCTSKFALAEHVQKISKIYQEI